MSRGGVTNAVVHGGARRLGSWAMKHGKGAGLVVATVLGLLVLAPAQAAAAGATSPRHAARQTLPVAPSPAAAPARPAMAPRKLDLPQGVGANVPVTRGTFFGPSVAIDPT